MRILPTIGPVSENLRSLKKISEYTEIFRLNGSHNNIKWHKKISINLKSINKNNKILIDIPGVKPRTNNNEIVKIKKNEEVIFYYNKKIKFIKSEVKKIPLTHPLPKIFKNIKKFSISDGSYNFKIKKISKNLLVGISLQSFDLKQKKGLNIPRSVYDDNRQIKLSVSFIKKVKNFSIDAIGLSFVQNERVIKIIKNKFPKFLIVAKIENSEGMKNIINIIRNADIVMIDRGDLSAEIGEENLFDAINQISKECQNFGKPLIMATENLESMISNSNPTKSEIVSLGFSHYVKSDSIMLSDETATSKNFLKIIKWLNIFTKEKDYKKQIVNKDIADDVFWNLFKKDLINIPLVIFSKKGYALDKVAKINKTSKIFLFTENRKLVTQSSFRANCKSFYTKKFPKSMEKFIFDNIKNKSREIFNNCSKIFLIHTSYPVKGSRANTFSIVSKKSILNY
jgi:pyruvate kinase